MKTILTIICALCITVISPIYCQINEALNPEENGFNVNHLNKLGDDIQSHQYGEVHSVIIVRNGDLVFEGYYNNYNRDKLHSLFSISKTITSALVGIALDRGIIENVNTPLLDFFSDYPVSDIDNLTPYKEALTLKHLLTMTSGYNYTQDDNNIWWGDDLMHYFFNAPVVDEPGTKWEYSNASSLMLSGILQRKSGFSAEDFAEKTYFDHWVFQLGIGAKLMISEMSLGTIPIQPLASVSDLSILLV